MYAAFFAFPAPALSPPQSVKMWRRPRLSARSSRAIMCSMLGRPPPRFQRDTVERYVPMRRAISDHDRPDSSLNRSSRSGKSSGEVVGLYVVVVALSRHRAGPPSAQPGPLSNASASIPSLVRLSAWAIRFPVGALASPVRPYVLAFFVAQDAPGSPEREGRSFPPAQPGAAPYSSGSWYPYSPEPSPVMPQARRDPSSPPAAFTASTRTM